MNQRLDFLYKKQIKASKTDSQSLFCILSDDEKYQLLEDMINGKIAVEDVAIYQMILEKYQKEVMAVVRPYIREGSQVVYYAPSKNMYKTRVPKALLVEGKTPPQTSTSELQLWKELYDYLIGEDESITLESLSKEWFESRKNDPDVTSKTYDRNINVWDKYFAGTPIISVPINKLTAKRIFDFFKSYTAGRQITRAELGNIKGIISMILDYAVVNDLIEFNVAKTVSTKSLKCKIVNNKYMVYTPEERNALFEYLKAIPANVYTLGIMLMFCLDIRIGELKALRWDDYNEASGQIYIHRQIVDRKDENGKWCQVELDYTKSGEDGDRWLPVSKTAASILSQLRLMSLGSEFILNNSAGTTIKTNKFNEYLKKYCEACGIRYLSSHKIRFYAVTEQVRAGIDLSTIQYNSGHRCKSTTLRYIRNAGRGTVSDEKWEKVFG